MPEARQQTFEPQMASIGPAIVTIGVFDGVHQGHLALIEQVVLSAQAQGIASIIITFDPDPDEVVLSTPAPKLLTHEQRIELLGTTGVSDVVTIPFTNDIANLPAEAFLETVLGRIADAKAIHVGENFRFGAAGAGDVTAMRRWCDGRDCAVFDHPLYEIDGVPVSATLIRECIEAGDVERASQYLGREYAVSGPVVHGRGEGKTIGFPTANILPPAGIVIPAEGVYAGYVLDSRGARYLASINVGAPPTFHVKTKSIEAHIIDFDEDIYGEKIVVVFTEQLRPQLSFASVEELKAAIQDSVDQTRERLGASPPKSRANVRYIAIGAIAGIAMGALFGLVVLKNPLIGAALGLAVGFAAGTAFSYGVQEERGDSDPF